MAFGAQIFNQNNIIQIDETTPVMQLYEKGTVGGPLVFTRYNLQTPLLALSPTNNSVAMAFGTSRSGNAWTFSFDFQVFNVGDTCNWYLFDRAAAMPTPPNTGWGMEIFDASGVRVYTSHHSPMRIAGNSYGPYASGRKYAFYQDRPMTEGTEQYEMREVENSHGGPPEYEYVFIGYRFEDKGWYLAAGGNQVISTVDPSKQFAGPSSFGVLDVTGL